MAAVTIAAETHNVVGTLKNGEKVVFSEFRPDDGTAGTIILRVSPLKQIYAYTWGIKSNNISGTEVSMVVNPGGTVSGKTTTSSNLLNLITGADMDCSGNTVVTVMSIGV